MLYYLHHFRPMDLLKMEEKLENGEYLTYTDFRTDFKLIVNNCRLYNGQNNGKLVTKAKSFYKNIHTVSYSN